MSYIIRLNVRALLALATGAADAERFDIPRQDLSTVLDAYTAQSSR